MFAKPSQTDIYDKYDEYRIHMETLMKAKLVEFDFSLRILIPLEKAGIRTLGDLTSRTREDLRKIPQIGRSSLETLERFLEYQRLSLKE